MKDNILSIIGLFGVAGGGCISIIEKATPILQVFSLLIGIAIGITILIINIRKILKSKK